MSRSQSARTGKLERKSTRHAIADGVVKGEFGRGRAGGAAKRQFENKRLFAGIADAVGGLLDGFTNPVVQDDFDALNERERVATAHGDRERLGGAGRRRFENFRGGVIHDEIVRLKGQTESVAGDARRRLGGNESGKINAVREARGVESHVGIPGRNHEIGPSGLALPANGKRGAYVVAIGIDERPKRHLGAGRWHDLAGKESRATAFARAQIIVFAGLTATIEAVSEETGTPVPILSERAVRPLAGLAEDELKDAIREAAADGGLTPRSLGKAASSRKAKTRKASIPRPVRLRVPGGIVTVEINRAGVAAGATVATLLTAAIEAATREAA